MILSIIYPTSFSLNFCAYSHLAPLIIFFLYVITSSVFCYPLLCVFPLHVICYYFMCVCLTRFLTFTTSTHYTGFFVSLFISAWYVLTTCSSLDAWIDWPTLLICFLLMVISLNLYNKVPRINPATMGYICVIIP